MTATETTADEPAQHPAGTGSAVGGVARVWVALVCVGCLGAGLWLAREPICFAVLLLAQAALWATALADSRGRDCVAFWLPAGAVLSLMLPLAVVVVAMATGTSGFSGPLAAWALMAGQVGLALSVSILRGGRVRLVRGDRSAATGFAVVLLFGVATAWLRPFEVWARNFGYSTDFDRHLYAVATLARTGQAPPPPLESVFHASVAWGANLFGWELGMAQLWQAVAGGLWVVLALVVLAVGSTAGRMSRAIARPSAAPGWASPAGTWLAILAVLSSVWFGPMLYRGYVTSIVGVLLLLVGLTAGVAAQSGRRVAPGVALAAAAIATLCNWQLLLPALLLCAVPLLTAWVARWRPGMLPAARVGLGGAVIASAVILWLLARGRDLAGPTMPDLAGLSLSGVMCLAAALGAAVVLERTGQQLLARSSALLLAGLLLVVLWLVIRHTLLVTQLPYYAAKTLWSAVAVSIPAAAACAIWGLDRVLRHGRPASWLGVAALGGAVLLASAGVAGRFHAIHRTGVAGPVLQIPLLEYLQANDLPRSAEQPYLVLALDPDSTRQSSPRYPGLADFVATEVPFWAVGPTRTSRERLQFNLLVRDLPGICRWLAANPDALRLTGPDPRLAERLLTSSGCPADVVGAPWRSVASPRWLVDLGPVGSGLPR